MITIVRLAVWDEIQAAIREREWSQNGVYRSTHFSDVLRTMQGIRGCALCSHAQDVHSKVIAFAPCLDCDCIGWTVLTQPNPSRSSY